MMLNWIWFAILTLVGGALALRSVALDRVRTPGDSDFWAMQFQLASHAALVMALVSSSDVIIKPVYAWLAAVLPQHGTQINQLTALVVAGVGCITFVFVVPFGVMIAEYARRERVDASRVTREAINRARSSRR